MVNSLHIQALDKAERLLGIKELARRLKSPEDTVRLWLNGFAPMPERKFPLLADILDEAGGPPK